MGASTTRENEKSRVTAFRYRRTLTTDFSYWRATSVDCGPGWRRSFYFRGAGDDRRD